MQYTRAIVELLQLLNYGVLHPTHGIVEVKKWPYSNSQVLGGSYFYLMLFILQSVYIALAATSYLNLYYINNYINWDQFNTLYMDNFLKEGTHIILLYKS
jgi:hypothetical protein